LGVKPYSGLAETRRIFFERSQRFESLTDLCARSTLLHFRKTQHFIAFGAVQQQSPVVDRQSTISEALFHWNDLQMTSFWHKTVYPFLTKVMAESVLAGKSRSFSYIRAKQ